MTRLLIVTEDVVKIQLLSGFLGRLYAKIYLTWYFFHLRLIAKILSKNNHLTILTSDAFKLKKYQQIFYSQELSKIDYSLNRQQYWETVNQCFSYFKLLNFQGIKLTELIKIKAITYLTYNYLVYLDLYQKIIHQQRPDKIVVLGSSRYAQLVEYVCLKEKITSQKINLPSLTFIQRWLNHFFLGREYCRKILSFLLQTLKKQPESQLIQRPLLLSLDFFRHLKILAPLYLNHPNPLFVTEIENPKRAIKNLNIDNPKYVFIASYLNFFKVIFSGFKLEIKHFLLMRSILKKTKHDFLINFCLQVIKPIIYHGLTLSSLYLQAADRLFQTIKPAGLAVVSDSRFVELSLSLTAKKYQVRSIMVSPNTLPDLAELNLYNTTDKVAVVGSFIREKLIKIGLPAKKIIITGDPSLENYQLPKPQISRDRVFSKLGLSSDQKLILAISFRPNWLIPLLEKEKFIRWTYQAVKQIPGAVVVFKPHPTEARSRLLEELSQWGINDALVLDNHQFSLYSLLPAASVVVQTWSMTLFEAVNFNRPVICVNPFGKNYDFFLPVIKKGGAVEVVSLPQLVSWSKILINHKNPLTIQQLSRAKQVIGKFILPTDGQATQRILAMLS